MQKIHSRKITQIILCLSSILFITGCTLKKNADKLSDEGYDGPDKAAEFEFNRTKDPATDIVPRERLLTAIQYTDSLKKILPFQIVAGYGSWTERGPNSDAVGASNGNTRANSGIASGRIRSILVDAADATGNTVFVGGVNGGIWKTTDITASPATWTFVNDFFSNMAITGICQNPAATATMYFCTGEWTFNADAVAGDGIFKSTNGGATWVQLASTTGTNFDYCSKILCDATGNVYVSTRAGVYRSIDGGTSWTTITPSGLSTSRFSDMELSSTGRLHVSAGQFSTCGYRYTDNPSTVAAGTWTSPASGYPSSSIRIELGCNGSTLYALPSDGSYQVPTIYKSTDGGATWAATGSTPAFTSGQGWYCLGIDIDPSNTSNVIVGSLDCFKTTNGGTSWSQISTWVGTTPVNQYVHADQQIIKWYDNGNKLLIGCDGGIHYSADKGTTIRDRNVGLRIKQFYSCAMHPNSGSNYFLAGAQDNGVHQFNNPGLSNTVEVTGGDGAFVAIDQNQSQYQFGSYVYNNYRRSTDGGATWSSVNFNNNGQFINPWDYDNINNHIYGGYLAAQYIYWSDPQTGGTAIAVSIPSFNSSSVTAVTVSPFTANRVYFGTAGGRVVKVDAANGRSPVDVNLTGAGMPAGTVSCIAVGSTDQYLMACYSNYGVASVWYSIDGGANWTSLDNNGINLPDMPVRWCMFAPGHDDAAIIATEAGVYLTHLFNGASTTWLPSPTFPTVRTDMLKYRSSDGLVAAATHGRGLWTQPYLSIVPLTKFLLRGKWNGNKTDLQWEYTRPASGAALEIEVSTDAGNFVLAGSVDAIESKYYSFTHHPNQQHVYYRIKATEANGLIKYSNTIKLFKNGSDQELQITKLYPNPVQNELNTAFIAEKGSVTYLITSAGGQTIWRKEEELQFTGAWLRNWNISGIKPGIYQLSIVANHKKVTQQFVKK